MFLSFREAVLYPCPGSHHSQMCKTSTTSHHNPTQVGQRTSPVIVNAY